MKRFIIIVILLAVVGAGGFFVYQRVSAQSGQATANLQTVAVERGTLVASVNAAGNVASPQTATLSWGLSGRVGKVSVAVGQVVEAGDVLMELDPASLDRSTVQAQADLISAQQALDTLLTPATEDQIAAAKLAVVQAQQAVTDTQRSLNYVLNPVGQSLYDAVNSAQVGYDAAQANLQLGQVSTYATQVQTAQNSLNQALSRLQSAQAQYPEGDPRLVGAQNGYQSALNAYETARLQYDTQIAGLQGATDTAKKALDLAQANLAAAQRGPDQAKVALYTAQLESAKANVTKAQRDLADLLADPDPQDVAAARARIAAIEVTLGQVRITAPFRATVVAVNSKVGDLANANQSAVALANLETLEVSVAVSEVDINRVQVGQQASITLDAAPGLTFSGQVAQVGTMGASQQGVVTFPVTILIPEPGSAIKPGMTAAVNIVTERRENVLLVPNRALRATTGGGRTVTVLFEGQQFTVSVTIGLSNEIYSEVTGGQLKEGDNVIVNLPASSSTSGDGGGPFFLGGGGFRP